MAINQLVPAATLDELAKTNCLSVQVENYTIVLFRYGEQVYAVDQRCPHMGFPLSKGSVRDGILTCHWHHARFDLESGGTFDPFADDVRVYPTLVKDGIVYVDTAPRPEDWRARWKGRLRDGLEQNLNLLMVK